MISDNNLIILGSVAAAIILSSNKKNSGGKTICPISSLDVSFGSYLNDNSLTRGLRNNNPGNIRRSGNDWIGKLPFNCSEDSEFEQFYGLQWGVRASMLNLNSYLNRGLSNIRDIISTWAPPEDNNNTEAYIDTVSRLTGIQEDRFLGNSIIESGKDIIFSLMSAIFAVEITPPGTNINNSYSRIFSEFRPIYEWVWQSL